MLGFVLTLHQVMVWLIWLGAAVALVLGVAWLYLTGTLAQLPQLARRAIRPPAPAAPPATEQPPAEHATPELRARVRDYFRYALAVVAGLGVLQALLGGALVLFFHCQPHEQLHYVYGLIVLLAIPVAFAYSDQAQVRRDVIIMTIAIVAILGAAVRAFMTGPGGICR